MEYLKSGGKCDMPELRTLLEEGHGLTVPGVYDPMTALLAEQAGFNSLYLSGASIAYTRLGRPDLGLVSVSEVVDTVALIADRVALPLIVDGDTGFGNASNVQRTVRQFERAGAAAIQLEDQSFPKRCGHLDGKELISINEMTGKVRAACDARNSDNFLVVARTDAIAVQGFEHALERAEYMVEAGADILFVEAPNSLDQMAEIAARFSNRVPLVANMVEGGKTPVSSAGELHERGFQLVIFPGGLVRAVLRQAQAYLTSLKQHGTNAPFRDNMADFDELNEVIGLQTMLAEAASYEK